MIESCEEGRSVEHNKIIGHGRSLCMSRHVNTARVLLCPPTSGLLRDTSEKIKLK